MPFKKWLNIYLLPFKKKRMTRLPSPGWTRSDHTFDRGHAKQTFTAKWGGTVEQESSWALGILCSCGEGLQGVGMASLAAEVERGGGEEQRVQGSLSAALCCPLWQRGFKLFKVYMYMYHMTKPTALNTKSFFIVTLNEWIVWFVNYLNKTPKKKRSESHWVVSDCSRPHGLYHPWNAPGLNTGVGSHSLLQGIFPTQGSNPGLPHCRRILHQLSHQGSPRILEWVAYPFSRAFSQPRNQTGVSCITGGFFTNWAIREALPKKKPSHNLKSGKPLSNPKAWKLP